MPVEFERASTRTRKKTHSDATCPREFQDKWHDSTSARRSQGPPYARWGKVWSFLVSLPPSSSFLLLSTLPRFAAASPRRREPWGIREACTTSIQVKRVNIPTLWTQVMGAPVPQNGLWSASRRRCFPPSVALICYQEMLFAHRHNASWIVN